MYQVTNDGSSTQIETGSRLVQIGAIFFLAIGALNVAAGFFSARAGDVFGSGVISLVVGVLYGFVPFKTVVKIDRAAGEFTRTAKALFKTTNNTVKLAEIESIAIVPGTYYWFFNVVRRDGAQLRLFGQMKMTWVTVMKPSADVLARGQEVAAALGVTLKG